jgi:hypothetical protein
MTMPEERRRNLIWGRDALEEFSQDASLPDSWRCEASALLNDYPPLEFLRICDASEIFQLDGYDEVLSRSRSLFQRVRASKFCSIERRYSLLVVLRHFY